MGDAVMWGPIAPYQCKMKRFSRKEYIGQFDICTEYAKAATRLDQKE